MYLCPSVMMGWDANPIEFIIPGLILILRIYLSHVHLRLTGGPRRNAFDLPERPTTIGLENQGFG